MPKKLDHNQLDAAEKVLGKTPILNKLELDKLIKFLKLLYLRPVLGVTFLVQMGFVAQYVFGNGTERTIDMIVLFTVLFVIVLIILSTLELKLQSYQSLLEIVNDQHKLIDDVTKSQEGLRNTWIIGWIELLKIKHQNLDELQFKIWLNDKIGYPEKEEIMTELMLAKREVTDEYEKLFPHLTNSMEHFQIGMRAPPPHPDSKSLDWITDMIDRLNKKVGIQ